MLHAFCNLSIQLVSQLTLFLCLLLLPLHQHLLPEPFKGIAKVFPSHRGASSQCYWPQTGDWRLQPTQLSFIAIPSLGLLYLLRHFNAIFMRISAHCNGPLSQYTRPRDAKITSIVIHVMHLVVVDVLRGSSAISLSLFQLTFHFFHSLSSQQYLTIFTSQVSRLYLTNFNSFLFT